LEERINGKKKAKQPASPKEPQPSPTTPASEENKGALPFKIALKSTNSVILNREREEANKPQSPTDGAVARNFTLSKAPAKKWGSSVSLTTTNGNDRPSWVKPQNDDDVVSSNPSWLNRGNNQSNLNRPQGNAPQPKGVGIIFGKLGVYDPSKAINQSSKRTRRVGPPSAEEEVGDFRELAVARGEVRVVVKRLRERMQVTSSYINMLIDGINQIDTKLGEPQDLLYTLDRFELGVTAMGENGLIKRRKKRKETPEPTKEESSRPKAIKHDMSKKSIKTRKVYQSKNQFDDSDGSST